MCYKTGYASFPPGGRKTMFLYHSQEELHSLYKSFQADLTRERVATTLANVPTFNITLKNKPS